MSIPSQEHQEGISLALALAMSTWTQRRDDQKLEVRSHCDLKITFLAVSQEVIPFIIAKVHTEMMRWYYLYQ